MKVVTPVVKAALVALVIRKPASLLERSCQVSITDGGLLLSAERARVKKRGASGRVTTVCVSVALVLDRLARLPL